jgi:hypothetical protein
VTDSGNSDDQMTDSELSQSDIRHCSPSFWEYTHILFVTVDIDGTVGYNTVIIKE